MSPAAIYKSIGEAIAKRRRVGHRKITQMDLSDRTHGRLSRSAIANIESGRQRVAVHHLYELASALGCVPEDLLPPFGEVGRATNAITEKLHADPEAKDFTQRLLRVGKQKSRPASQARTGKKEVRA